MRFLLTAACAALVAGSRLAARQAVDPNDDNPSDDWYLEALSREADGPGANATGKASFTSHNLTRANLDDDPDVDWEIELRVFANITVERGGRNPSTRHDQTGSVLRYMPKENETISDDHYVCASGFTVEPKDHKLGDNDDLEQDCSNALAEDCLEWLRHPGISLCSPLSTPPSSCKSNNRFIYNVKNGTADPSDPPALWLNEAFGDEDGNDLSGSDAYDHVIRQLYVASWGVYSTTQNEEGDKMPGGDEKEYFLRCLRADNIKEGSRTMEDAAAGSGPNIALIMGLALVTAVFL